MRKRRSDITREGLARTPHRAFMRAMGLDDAAIQKPMIGVVSMKGVHLLHAWYAAKYDQPRFGMRSGGNSLSARLPAVISQLRMATIAGASFVACGA